MKNLLFIIILIFSSTSNANQITKLAVHPLIESALLTTISNHLISNELTNDEFLSIKGSIEKINSKTIIFKPTDLINFINIIFYKTFLNHLQDEYSSNEQVTSSQLFVLTEKLKAKELIYSELSKFIILSIQKDFSVYLENDFILHYQNGSRKESKNLVMIKELKLKEKYLLPWIKKVIALPAKDFNLFINSFLKIYLDNLSSRIESYSMLGLYAQHRQKLFPEFEFALNSPEKTEDAANEPAKDPLESIEKVKDDAASEVIDKIIEKIPE